MKRLSNSIVFLEVSSYCGYGGGAEHYYGKLRMHRVRSIKDVELLRKMTSKDVIHLSKKDNFVGEYRYKVGKKTNRFNSYEDLIDFAKDVWLKHFPKAKLLVKGSSSTCDPQLVLVGPDKYKDEVNKLYKIKNDNYTKYGNFKDESVYDMVLEKFDELNLKFFGVEY